MKNISNKEKIKQLNEKFEKLGFQKIKDELGRVYYLNEEYDCQVIRMETHWGIEVTKKNRNAHVYIKRFSKINAFYQNPCKHGFPSALKWLRENKDWKIDRTNEVLYTLTERCAWERETWNFYFSANLNDIEKIKSICKRKWKNPFSHTMYYPFKLSPTPNTTIDEALRLDGTGHTSYLPQHVYVGEVCIPQKYKTNSQLMNLLYKGGLLSIKVDNNKNKDKVCV